jgi:hypothetical protein
MDRKTLLISAVFGLAVAGICMGFAWIVAPDAHSVLQKKIGPGGWYEYESGLGSKGSTFINRVGIICFASWWGASGRDSSCPKKFNRQHVTSEYVTLSALFGPVRLTTRIDSVDKNLKYEIGDQAIVRNWWNNSWSDGISIGFFCAIVAHGVLLWRREKRQTASTAVEPGPSSSNQPT